VQVRLLREVSTRLGSDRLRTELAAMLSAAGSLPFHLGGRTAFRALMQRLRAAAEEAASQAEELRQMLDASFVQLNTEFGFAFALGPAPSLAPYRSELGLIEENYARYFGFAQAWRMATPGFAEQFRRMLLAKLRVVFENATGEVEMWSKAAAGQVELQLRERRRGFAHRRDALQRVQAAAGELEQRIAEVQQQDEHLERLQEQLERVAEDALAEARRLHAEPVLPPARAA
jgi:DNA repair exonuclease SbcCD ATPase subunit